MKLIPTVGNDIDMTPSVEPPTGMKATPTAGPSVSGRDSKKRGWKPPRTNIGAYPRNIGPSMRYIQIPTISPRMAVLQHRVGVGHALVRGVRHAHEEHE